MSSQDAAHEEVDGRATPAWGWIAAGLALTTGSTLLLEVTITRIFSVVLIYHFAFMAISLALFGIGVAGIFIYLYPERFRRRALSLTSSRLALLYAGACVAALVGFHLRVSTATQWPLPFSTVMEVFLLMAAPFFLSGLTVALPISRCTERIGFLYGADLLGAAAGAALAIPTLGWLGGPLSVVACAVLACVAALCFAVAAGSRPWGVAAGLGAIACVVLVFAAGAADWFALRHSRFGPETELMFQKWNSFSRISVWGPYYDGSRWRLGEGAPRPGAGAGEGAATHLSIVIDGGAKTPMPAFDGDFAPLAYFEHDITSLGYQARPAKSALIIGSGGGRDILTARLLGVESIRAVEINPLIVSMVREQFRDFSGSPYDLPGVEYTLSDGRSFAAESTESFDVVQLSAVDTFAASGGGALALVEHSLYTVEAFRDYHDRLSDDGLLSLTHFWGLNVPEPALRAVDVFRRAWVSRGHEDPAQHVIVIGRKTAWGTLLASRRPFRPDEVRRIVRRARQLGFGILYAPGFPGSLPALVELLGPDPESLLARQAKDVRATTDDRPFFFFFERPGEFLRAGLGGLFEAPRYRRSQSQVSTQAPTLLVRLLLWMLALNLLFVFLLPMGLGRLRLGAARGAGRPLLWFACIGLGFISVELPLIQRYTLLLGKPIYAFAVILGCVLVASGLGAMASARVPTERLASAARIVVLAVIAGTVLHAFLGPPLLAAALRYDLGVRVLLTLVSVAPLGFVMGMPLPLGVRMLEQRAPQAIAWGWGINGSLSVVGTILAMMVSVTAGLTATLLFGAAAYAVALVAPRGASRA